MKPVAVLGAGSWGTALSWHLGETGRQVRLWARRPDLVERMREEGSNPEYLPEARFAPGVQATADLAEAVDGAAVVIVAIPSHGFRQVCRDLAPLLESGRILVSATKGIEMESLQRMSQVLADELPGSVPAVLSGPSFAREVVEGHPTAVVAASESLEAAGEVRDLFTAPTLRVYTQQDVVGVEIGGAAKNVVSIAAGAVEGLGFGTNTLAALVTRGLREISRLAAAVGGEERTLAGLAGLGDLVLTAMGSLSRNKQVGLRLARGESLEEIQAGMSEVAEGVRTTRSVNRLARRAGVEVPIASMVEAVLYEGRSPREAVSELMSRESKGEFE